MRRLKLPEPDREEILRRLAALPPPPDPTPTGGAIVWGMAAAAVWLLAGLAGLLIYWMVP